MIYEYVYIDMSHFNKCTQLGLELVLFLNFKFIATASVGIL